MITSGYLVNLSLRKRDILDTDIVAGGMPPYRPVHLRKFELFRFGHGNLSPAESMVVEVEGRPEGLI